MCRVDQTSLQPKVVELFFQGFSTLFFPQTKGLAKELLWESTMTWGVGMEFEWNSLGKSCCNI